MTRWKLRFQTRSELRARLKTKHGTEKHPQIAQIHADYQGAASSHLRESAKSADQTDF
jgi:hypothetical protein